MKERFIILPFWKVTRWGFLKPFGFGGDEWGNPSVYIIIPLVGMVVFFYSVHMDRESWFKIGSNGESILYMSPDYEREASFHFHANLDFDDYPDNLTDKYVRTYADIVGTYYED